MAAMTRYHPFQPIRSLQREIDRLFGDFRPMFGEEEEAASAVWAPSMDLTETEGEYIVKMDVPGVSKEDVVVSLEDKRLSVRGERREERKEESENRLALERSYGSFYRSFALPNAASEEDVAAQMNDGVLTIRVKKVEASKPRRIEIA